MASGEAPILSIYNMPGYVLGIDARWLDINQGFNNVFNKYSFNTHYVPVTLLRSEDSSKHRA
jgi:hypothetical protein